MKLFLLFSLVLFVRAEVEKQNKTGGFGSSFSGITSKEGTIDSSETQPVEVHDQNEDINHPKLLSEPPKKEKGRLSGIGRGIVKATGKGISSVADTVGSGISSAVKAGTSFIPTPKTGGFDSIIDKIPGADTFGKVADEILDRARAIYPGTKWCGGGNISKSDHDLGLFADTDVCCRDHDMCPNNIASGTTKHGLYNNGLFTRSHCDCDTEFYDCLLKNSKSSLPSSQLGITYFNILGPQCFKEDYPIKSCLKSVVTDSNLTKCTEYELDTSSKPVFQWFDNKLFWGVPLING
ncbi:uncharacterized protein LOC123301821 [Chrysoperla carnea]|uniref:uncharacterized protein LOC123301821 n=1 Tax=Chrysoperla carnea TaxID=189513 RepID=UPI001D0984AC|nr:uncharacterized protein LOC123301821 [Chrysoperla carnea]